MARAKAGSSVAFEALDRRYRERITAYVRTLVRDHGRAEDVVQEIFVCAFRKLKTLDDPSAFRSWIYGIARNASLDEVRRVKRNGEVFIRSNDFAPYERTPQRHSPSAHRSLSSKEELSHLTEALGGLPASQHEALILREFGGMSYDEIGAKMNLSRPAVESIIFRARRGLKDEYSQITTGERCRQMQLAMAEGTSGIRERRLLLRHMRECTGCRRQAVALGFAGIAVPPEQGRFRRAISRAAAVIPLPFLFSRRPEDSDSVSGGSTFTVQAQNIATQLSSAGGISADHATSAIHKAAAVVAAVAVIGGGGVAVEQSGVRLPGIDRDAKTHKAAGTSRPADKTSAAPSEAGSGSKAPPKHPGAKAGAPPAGGGAVPPAGAGTAAPGSAAPAAPSTGTKPDSVTSPDPSAPAPALDTPATTGTPGTGSGTSQDTSGGTGPASGGTSTTSGGTSTPSSSPTGGTPATGSSPALDGLPPGLVNQIESGKRTPDTLPPGQKKKLAALAALAA